jgi:hypothetical protein
MKPVNSQVSAWWVLLLVAVGSCGSARAEDSEETEQLPITWVDTSHAYATNATQDLVQWMDDFFGAPIEDAERAESYLRLILIDDWDTSDQHSFKARVRGQVQMPKLSERIALVFAGDDGEELSEEEREEEDTVGLRYEILEAARSRVDLTMGLSTSQLKPGIRFRQRAPLFSENSSYRFTQRIQYWTEDGWLGISQLDLNPRLTEDSVVSWNSRLRYGEETDGTEWRTGINLRTRYRADDDRPIGFQYFARVNGVTDPSNYVRNYSLGVLFRRQIYRDYLFFEAEPTVNWRQDEFDDDRDVVWGIVFRLEIALLEDLRRTGDRDDSSD